MIIAQNSLMISYLTYPRGPESGYSSGLSYGIEDNNDYFYIAFRKANGNNRRLAWLKAKLYGYDPGIILHSCRYTDNADELVIK